MKKLLGTLLLLASIIVMSSCINDEEDTEFDLISPTDSTESSNTNANSRFKNRSEDYEHFLGKKLFTLNLEPLP